MALGIIAIACACLAILFTVLGFVLTAVPFAGTLLSLAAPVIALAGVVIGGIGLSRASKDGQPTGIHIAGVITSVIAFLPAVLIALTCGLCNAVCSAASLVSLPDASAYPTPPPDPPFDDSKPTDDLDEARGDPTPEELAAAADELNELCPDTFCEGEFDYVFETLECTPSACTVTFEAKHYTAPEDAPYATGSIEVPGADDLLSCHSRVVGSPTCDVWGLHFDWILRAGEVLGAWEEANRPR